MPMWMFVNFQDSASPLMEQLTIFNDHRIILLVYLTIFTLYLVAHPLTQASFNKFYIEGQQLEFLWTTLPVLMLFFVAVPSIKVLYLIEESKVPSLRVKICGRQWYWSYEQSVVSLKESEGFIRPSRISRLLKSRGGVRVPFYCWTRLVITSSDVIHSWAIPSMGLKVDALPGRLNQLLVFPKRPGLFLGQCSEICGTNHSFIPTYLSVGGVKEILETN